MSEAVSAFPEAGSVEGEQAAAPWRPPPAAAPVWPEVWEMPPGVLPRQRLREAERLGVIGTTGVEIPEASFQPASLDLLLGPTAYRIGSSFLPGEQTVRERLKRLQLDKGIDIRSGGILEPNRPYLIPLMERLRLPANVRAFANPKSSTGRVDIFTRVVSDRSHRFDEIAPGYEGELWLEVFSRSFLVKVHAGMALNQMRFHVEETDGAALPPDLPATAPERVRIQLRPPEREPDLGEREEGGPMPVGFKAKRNNSALLDLSRRDHDPREFWEPIWPSSQLVLEPEEFYLLRSREQIAIPAGLAAEMVAFEPTSGELRTHYAGFFDPGFGTGVPAGLPAVLEVRAHDVPFMLEDGQEVARFRYQKLAGPPDRLYGREAGSHYGDERQWRFLSKHFRSWGQLPLRF